VLAAGVVAFTLVPSISVAQDPPKMLGPFILNRAIITIRAGSAEEAKQFARSIQNFKLDEQFGAIDMTNGEFFLRGDKTGPLHDPSGHLHLEAPDAIMGPAGH
jgi:hypothetical protein